MRKFLTVLLVALFAGCAESNSGSEDLENFIPDNSVLILKLEDPDLFFSNLKNNDLLRKNRDFPLAQDLKESLSLLNYFTHKDPAYLTITVSKGDIRFVFITREIPEIATDTVQNRMVESLTVNGQKIKKYTLENQVAFTAVKDSIYIFSNARNLLENSLEGKGKIQESEGFRKAMKAASSKKPGIFLNHEKLTPLIRSWFPNEKLSFLENFSKWTVVDADISQSAIKLNGITTAQDSLIHRIDLFKGVGASENLLANITPDQSQGFYSISFERFSPLFTNLQAYNQLDPKDVPAEKALLETASEAGMIYMEEGNVLAIRTLDQEAARRALSAHQELLEEFRGIEIKKYDESLDILSPLLSPEDLQAYAHLDQFVLFSRSPEAIKSVISAFQNEQVISNNEAFRNTFESLSTEASILLVANNSSFKEKVAKMISGNLENEIKELEFNSYPLSALQFIYQDDFAHVHAVITKNEEVRKANTISQIAAVHLDADVVTRPVFFKNHRSNGNDIAVQDANNILYLISPEGDIYWKKQLEARILGDINTVDILRNGRYQMAFATPKKIHVIDRTGKPVPPFPLEFKDNITQPLAVFDYDNNRKYRFVIVQDRQLYMYDNKGRGVNGFNFTRAETTIIQPPKHIRIGRKDYILVLENSGKLNILSRTGRVRVPVKGSIDFSENEWFEYEDNFVSTNVAGELMKIDQQGKIQKQDLNLAPNHRMDATVKRFVTISDNVVNIKGEDISLDFGLYTAPKIFYINNKIYITITDTQAHKVYLFDSSGKLLNGFPVYGNSSIDLSNADSDPDPELVVQGEENSIIIYEVH